jgi:hypothetical protein
VVDGTAASLRAGRQLAASSGAYSIAGTDAAFAAGRRLVVDAGAYAWAGTAADLIYTPSGGYLLAADAGAFLVTGTDAGLIYTPLVEPPGASGGGGPIGLGRRKPPVEPLGDDDLLGVLVPPWITGGRRS